MGSDIVDAVQSEVATIENHCNEIAKQNTEMLERLLSQMTVTSSGKRERTTVKTTTSYQLVGDNFRTTQRYQKQHYDRETTSGRYHRETWCGSTSQLF